MADLSLEIVEGRGAGQRIPLAGAVEIGREPGLALVLDDPLASRRHARVAPSSGGAVAEDLGSSNGTFVNNAEIHGPTRLDPGDRLVIGTTVVELRSAAQVAARPSAVIPSPIAFAAPARSPDYLASASSPSSAPAVGGQRPGDSALYALLDAKTKRKARLAPLAILVLVVFAVILFLALR